uniref:Major facilitator superfamily (MFS) profile domain-containing protein n=1 Tax=Glossina austeni TaxID=7395 RepID=A0A1A9VQ53_GLOAU
MVYASRKATLKTELVHSWQIFLLICGLPSLLSGVIFIVLPESPKFLMSQGRNTEIVPVIRHAPYQCNPALENASEHHFLGLPFGAVDFPEVKYGVKFFESNHEFICSHISGIADDLGVKLDRFKTTSRRAGSMPTAVSATSVLGPSSSFAAGSMPTTVSATSVLGPSSSFAAGSMPTTYPESPITKSWV